MVGLGGSEWICSGSERRVRKVFYPVWLTTMPGFQNPQVAQSNNIFGEWKNEKKQLNEKKTEIAGMSNRRFTTNLSEEEKQKIYNQYRKLFQKRRLNNLQTPCHTMFHVLL